MLPLFALLAVVGGTHGVGLGAYATETDVRARLILILPCAPS